MILEGNRKRGKCFICGKPTALLIHAACSKKAEANQAGPFGFGSVTKKQHSDAQKKQRAKMYVAGKLPYWMAT